MADDHEFATDLALVEYAALQAGQIALGYFRKTIRIDWKNGGTSPVTEADHAANALLENILRKARPHYGWLSEESENEPDRLNRDYVFVIDPIDGTRAFMNGLDDWAVSVAVTHNGKPSSAALYAPAHQKLYLADDRGHVSLNGKAILPHVSKTEEKFILSGRLEDLGHFRLDPEILKNKVKTVPSLALRIAHVAEGKLDGTLVKPSSHDWDLAAAHLILTNMGGKLTGLEGAALVYNKAEPKHPALIAASSHCHAFLINAQG